MFIEQAVEYNQIVDFEVHPVDSGDPDVKTSPEIVVTLGELDIPVPKTVVLSTGSRVEVCYGPDTRLGKISSAESAFDGPRLILTVTDEGEDYIEYVRTGDLDSAYRLKALDFQPIIWYNY